MDLLGVDSEKNYMLSGSNPSEKYAQPHGSPSSKVRSLKIAVDFLLLLMKEIPNNHLGCIKTCK